MRAFKKRKPMPHPLPVPVPRPRRAKPNSLTPPVASRLTERRGYTSRPRRSQKLNFSLAFGGPSESITTHLTKRDIMISSNPGEFNLCETRHSIEDRARFWQDWETPKFKAFASDLRAALVSLDSRPKPNDKAGAYARGRLEKELATVEGLLKAVDHTAREAARAVALEAARVLNEANEASANASTVEEQLNSDAAIKIGRKNQVRL